MQANALGPLLANQQRAAPTRGTATTTASTTRARPQRAQRSIPAGAGRYQQAQLTPRGRSSSFNCPCPHSGALSEGPARHTAPLHRPHAKRPGLNPNNARVEQGPQHRPKKHLHHPKLRKDSQLFSLATFSPFIQPTPPCPLHRLASIRRFFILSKLQIVH